MLRKRLIASLAFVFVLCLTAGAWADWNDAHKTIVTSHDTEKTANQMAFMDSQNVSTTERVDTVAASADWKNAVADRLYYVDTDKRLWLAVVSNDGIARGEATGLRLASPDAAMVANPSLKNLDDLGTGSIDMLIIRAGLNTKQLNFTISADNNGTADGDTGITLQWATANGPFTFDDGDTTLTSDDFVGEDTLSGDSRFEWGKPCCPNTCNALYHDVVRLVSDDPGYSKSYWMDSADVYVYVPCCNVEKRWQLTPYDKRVHFADMVLFSSDASGSFDIDMGGYVVEVATGLQNPLPDTVGLTTGDNDRVFTFITSMDYVSEWVLNHSPFGLRPQTTHWDFSAVWESSADYDVDENANWNGGGRTLLTYGWGVNDLRDMHYASRRLVTSLVEVGRGDQVSGDFYQYLGYLNGETSADAHGTYTNRWYSFVSEDFSGNFPMALAPGFGQFLGVYPAFSPAGASASDGFEMNYFFKRNDGGNYGTGMCQTVHILPRYWYAWPTCATAPAGNYLEEQANAWETPYNTVTCWNLTPMSHDVATGTEYVAAMTDVEASDLGYLLQGEKGCLCGGVVYSITNQSGFSAGDAGDGTICDSVSFDIVAQGTCWSGIKIMPVKIEALINRNQLCHPETVAAVDAALALLGQEVDADCNAGIVNVGPVDAFLDNARVRGLDTATDPKENVALLWKDYSGGIVNLGSLAEAAVDSTKPWQGLKNFIRVWPAANSDAGTQYAVRKPVKEAWADGDQLEFSFYAVLVAADVPAGEATVQAMNGYYLIYTGADDNLEGKVAFASGYTAPSPTTPTPMPTTAPTGTVTPTTAPTTAPTATTAPSGSGGGSGCSMGFAPLALILLAPLALLKK